MSSQGSRSDPGQTGEGVELANGDRAAEAPTTPPRGTLLAGTALFGAISFLGYGLSFFKSILLTRFFGTSASMDAYAIGMMIPTVLAGLLANSCAGALVPALSVAERERPGERANVFRGSLALVAWAAVAATFLLWLSSAPLLRLLVPHFGPDRLPLASQVLRLASPLVLLNAVFWFAAAELLSRRRYAAAAAVPALYQVGPICALLLFPGVGVTVLVAGSLTGAVIMASGYAWVALRHNRTSNPLRLWTPSTRRVLVSQGQLVFVSAYAVTNLFVDQAMAGLLPVGNVSALNYATMIDAIVQQTVVLALASVVFPDFANLAAAGDYALLKERARSCIKGVVLLAAPVCVLILTLGRLAIRLIFQHGAFSAHSTALVFDVWAGYTLGLVPTSIGMIAAKLMQALNLQGVLARMVLVLVPLNAALDYVLMLRLGCFGISLSTSFVYLVAACWFLVVLRRRIGSLFDGDTRKAVGSSLGAAGLAAIPLVVIRLTAGESLLALATGALVFLGVLVFMYRWLGLDRNLPTKVQFLLGWFGRNRSIIPA